MSAERFVIIGNGPAANEAARVLRENSEDARITIFGKEPSRPYKPHLLPDVIAGKIHIDKIYLRPDSFYVERNIQLRTGQRVAKVDFGKHHVILEHREVVPFDGLIIATGGRPRIPEPIEVFEDAMMTLKTVSDAQLWINKLAKVETVLLIGGDLTSLGLTRALLSLGKTVFFMINEDSFWPLPLNQRLHNEIDSCLCAKGVNVLKSRHVKRLSVLSETSMEVETECEKLLVGAVGAFFGLVPDVKFLVRSGLDIDRGVLVDEKLQTRFANVYAAGDCAQVYNPSIRDYWVSIGYENARTLGRIAALNMLGGMVKMETALESIFSLNGVKVNTSWWMEF